MFVYQHHILKVAPQTDWVSPHIGLFYLVRRMKFLSYFWKSKVSCVAWNSILFGNNLLLLKLRLLTVV